MKLRLNKLSRLYFGLALSFFFVNILFLPAQGERADDPGARECEFMKHRSAGAPGAYPTPAHTLRYERKKHRQDRVPFPGGTPKEPAKNHWMPLGPFAVNVGDKYGAISGRVTGIAFGKMAPNGRPRVYAATANGGVWYSDNSGDSWHHFKDYLANTIDVEVEMPNVDLMSCGAIATSNNGNFIFVGTGEGSRYAADCQLAYEGYSYNGVGVLFSSDEGQSWKREPSTPSLVGHAFFQLAVDPNDPNNVLGATTNGLYRRVDDASSPTKYSWVRQDMGREDNSVSSVVVAKGGNGKTVFYAARWGGGVFIYDDGDGKWKEAGTGFPREWKFGKVSQADSDSMKKLLDTAALLDKALTQEDTVNVLMIALKNNVWRDTTLCNKFLKALGENPVLFLPLLVAGKQLDTELINELFAAALKNEVWKDDAFKKKPPVAEALKNMVPTRTAIYKEFAKYNAILGEEGKKIYVIKKVTGSQASYTIKDAEFNHTFVMSAAPQKTFLKSSDYHVGRIELAVQPNNPNIVYAIAAGEEPKAGGLFGIYRLNRAGDNTWHPVKGDCTGVFGGRGWWQMAFAVDPSNASRLYIAGTKFYYFDLTVKSDWEISGEKKEVCGYWNMVHPDMHVLTYEPKADGTLDPDKLWNGNDGGLNYCGNATSAAPVFYSKNPGLPTILMEGFGQHPTEDAVIYAGTQDMAAVEYNGSAAWDTRGDSDCGQVLVNWAEPENMLQSNIGGWIDYYINGIWKGDASVPGVGDIPSAYGDNQPTVLAYAPLAGTPYNKDTTSQADRIAFGSNKVWLNDQFGKKSEWKSIADMDVSGPDARIKTLTFASYGKIYAGTMDGQVYRLTENQDKTWKKERLDNLGGLTATQVPITDIAIDPKDKAGKSIYITLGGMGDYRRVWRFDGATSKWEQRSGPDPAGYTNGLSPSLPDVQHNTIVVDPQAPITLYAGSDVGIYYSTDAGQSWMPYSNGLPGVPVNHLKIFPEPGPNGQGQKTDDSRRFLRAATYGRGMFERSLNKDFNNSGPLLYIRKNEMDRGFYDVPPGAGINDSPDIKISYPNGAGRYPFEGPGAVSFYDFSILPDGLAFNRQAINSPALTSDATDTVLTDGIIQRRYSKQASLPEVFRVYAQIHNNGRKWPKDVKVYVLASKDATLPDLPSNFMTTLRSLAPNNKVGSNWILLGTQSLSPPANWEPGVPMVATIELSKSNIPKDSGSKVQLLVLVDSGDAPLNSTPTQVDALVRGSRGAALKSFQIQTTSLGAWKLISGVEAGDVAANSKGDIYVTSKSAVAGGYSIFRYDDNSAKWNPIPGGLTRLALSDDGTLWGVDDAGSVLKREFANQAWAWKTVADTVMAQDIGVGPNGEVWIIGKERLEPYPDHWVCQVLKDGTLKKEEAAISLRIAVDPLGMPWSVNSGGGLFQKVNEEWKFWSGTDGNVMDVGVNQGGAWVTDKYDKIYYFTGMPGNYWKAIDGRAQQISVGKNGLPVVVNSAGEVYVRQ